MLETLEVKTNQCDYAIRIGAGMILDQKSSFLQKETAIPKWVLITDEQVADVYEDWLSTLPQQTVQQLILPPGEKSKTMIQAERVLEKLADAGLTRQDGLIAFGGGVVGDLTGFCASIYMRGIPWIQIPTTLLAQVDSSVGGKTGVNLKSGKNMVGSFHQPSQVWIDPLLLRTLPESEYWGGCSEVIKYGIIQGNDFRQWLHSHWPGISLRDPAVMTPLIKRCLECKSDVVQKYEKEKGLRKILNFGHTIGHATEKLLGYQITHGEALRYGMLMELTLAYRLDRIGEKDWMELKALVSRIPETHPVPGWPAETLIKAMASDKKNRQNSISFMLPGNHQELEEVLLTGNELVKILKSFS